MDASQIIGLVLTLATSGTAAGLVTVFFQRKKLKAESARAEAEAAQVLSQTALSMIEPLRTQVSGLHDSLDTANSRIVDLSSRLERSNSRVRDLEFQVETLSNQLRVAELRIHEYQERLG